MTNSARGISLNGAAVRGDDFVRAFNAVRAELVSTLYFVLGNQDDAQDAAQDAFLKCWRSLETLAGVENLRAWIFRVGLNAAKDMQRNAWRRRAKPMTDSTHEPQAREAAPDEAFAEKEGLGRIREALMNLRDDEQAVFLLRQNGDLTFEEIAQMRRVPVGTVKTQMRSALRKLRGVLCNKES